MRKSNVLRGGGHIYESKRGVHHRRRDTLQVQGLQRESRNNKRVYACFSGYEEKKVVLSLYECLRKI
jgi:hypothetical protein